MPTTSRGYPYPAGVDPANGPAGLQALAAAVDTDLSAVLPPLAVTSFGDLGSFVGTDVSSTTLPSGANSGVVAIICPTFTFTPTKFAWWESVQNGNYDVAIIDATTRARLWSLGSTAAPAAGAIVNAIVAGPTLTAGTRYGLVIASSSATFAFECSPQLSSGAATLYDGTIGFGTAAAAFPVPATFPVWTEAAYAPAIALRA